MKVDIPEGSSGRWRVERFTVDSGAARVEALRAAFHGGRGVPAGSYTRLLCNGHVVMSDTPDEVADHRKPIEKAQGLCLVHGLGLGMVVAAMLEKDDVRHVTVVEKSEDVIHLVAPHLAERYGGGHSAQPEIFYGNQEAVQTERLTVVQGDAFTWKPPKGCCWDVVWHDIWPDLCVDNLPEMKKLHRRFGRRSAWQGSWARPIVEREARRIERQRRNWPGRWQW